jgi:hypothetical protein
VVTFYCPYGDISALPNDRPIYAWPTISGKSDDPSVRELTDGSFQKFGNLCFLFWRGGSPDEVQTKILKQSEYLNQHVKELKEQQKVMEKE